MSSVASILTINSRRTRLFFFLNTCIARKCAGGCKGTQTSKTSLWHWKRNNLH